MAASLCEVCEQRQQATQGLCYVCVLDGLRKIKEKGDPNLERYQQLVSARPLREVATLGAVR